MAIFVQKPWVNSFRIMAIFRVFELLFYSLEWRFFVLEYRKTHFPVLYWLKKKKLEKWPFLEKKKNMG